jgi:UDP-glucose 4-epimerase
MDVVVRRLVEVGCVVRVLDDLSSGSVVNLSGLDGSVEFIRGDVRSREVVHGAAQIYLKPWRSLNSNLKQR